MASGALIGLVALVALLVGPHLDRSGSLALLLGPPVIALMSRFPLVLDRASSGIEVGFDSAVLVFLACFDGGAGALGDLGRRPGALPGQPRPSGRTSALFNIGLGDPVRLRAPLP